MPCVAAGFYGSFRSCSIEDVVGRYCSIMADPEDFNNAIEDICDDVGISCGYDGRSGRGAHMDINFNPPNDHNFSILPYHHVDDHEDFPGEITIFVDRDLSNGCSHVSIRTEWFTRRLEDIYIDVFPIGAKYVKYIVDNEDDFSVFLMYIRRLLEVTVHDNKRQLAAQTIQSQWRKCVSEPAYAVCCRLKLR